MTYNIMFFKQKEQYYSFKQQFETWEDMTSYLFTIKNREIEDKYQNYHMLSANTIDGDRLTESIIESSKWIALDFDSMGSMDLKTFYSKYKFHGWESVFYNSSSCKNDSLRMRIVHPLTRKINRKEYKHFWINLNRCYDNLLDRQTCHINRTQAAPATFKHAYNFFYRKLGNPIDVDEIKDMFPYVEKKKLNIIDIPGYDEYRKKKLNKFYKWSGVGDCPFIPKNKLANFYNIYNTDNTGRYKTFYELMCSITYYAYKNGYPLSQEELINLLREIDYNNLYKKRALDVETRNAIEFAMQRV